MQRLTHSTRRRGFSFTEVLFAVVILGIGFIMVAAIFPVAIQQSKLTIDETTGASLARGAVRYLETSMTDYNAARTGVVNTTTSNCPPAAGQNVGSVSLVQQVGYLPGAHDAPYLWTAIRGNIVLPEDPRYGFVSLYSRGGVPGTPPWSTSAQVFVFAVQSTEKPIFDASTDAFASSTIGSTDATNIGGEANLMAHSVRVAIVHNVSALGNVDLIAFDTSTSGGPNLVQQFNAGGGSNPNPGTGAAVEGGYVIIADDHLTTTETIAGVTHKDQGTMNGHVYKIGQRRSDLDSQISTYFPSTGSYKPFETLQAGYIFEIDPSTPFIPNSGGDGVTRVYSGSGTSADDIVGIGNKNPLKAELPVAANSGTTALVPMSPAATVAGTADAFVVGRSYADPNNPSAGFTGGSMVVGYYTTFVKVN